MILRSEPAAQASLGVERGTLGRLADGLATRCFRAGEGFRADLSRTPHSRSPRPILPREHRLARRRHARHGHWLDDALRPDRPRPLSAYRLGCRRRYRESSAAHWKRPDDPARKLYRAAPLPLATAWTRHRPELADGWAPDELLTPNGAIAACWPAFTVSRSRPCASRSSRSPRRNSCAGCCAGSTLRRSRSCWASAALLRGPPPVAGFRDPGECLGDGRFWRAASSTTIPQCSTSFA